MTWGHTKKTIISFREFKFIVESLEVYNLDKYLIFWHEVLITIIEIKTKILQKREKLIQIEGFF